MKKQNLLVYITIVTALFAIVSCSKWDDYKQYTAKGETSYTGKIDSVKILSGKLRVRVIGLLPADPKIAKVKISWNDKRDSVEFPITKRGAIETFDQTFSVDEGVKNFLIQTFDAVGNGSVVVNTTGIVYGPKYESGLVNRPIKTAELLTTGNAVVTWDAFDTSSGAKATYINYTSAANASVTVFNPVKNASDTIKNFKAGTSITYRTMYLPTATSIDTFYTTYQTQTVLYNEDVTTRYLSNASTPFAPGTVFSSDGRFGKLGAPWITNAAGLNKGGGTYGGWAADGWQGTTGFINWETYGNTPVTNGIVYQPTSAPLPAGKYIVEYNYYSEIQTNSSVYCIVAAGANGLPVLANLSTALASSALYNGTVVGTTQPSRDETKSFSFTLTTPQVVSIGFLGNLTANNYFIVRRIKLLWNH